MGNEHRSDHYNEEVPQPVVDGRESVSLGTSLERVDLSRVEPGQRKPCGTEEGNVGEETDGGTSSVHRVVGNKTGEDEDHGQALADSTVKEKLATSNALDEEHGGGCEGGVDDHVDTTEQIRQILAGADGLAEQDREVVNDSVATGKLLHELRAGAEQHATEMLSLATSEQNLRADLFTETTSSLDGVEKDTSLELDLGVICGFGVESC